MFKNKLFLTLLISTISFLLLKGCLYLGGVELGLGGTYTQKRALITNIVLFGLLLFLVFAALKEKVGFFNFFFVLFAFVLIEGIIEERNGKIGLRRTITTTPKKDTTATKSTLNGTAQKGQQNTKRKNLVANKENATDHNLFGYTLIPGEFLTIKKCYNVVYTNTKDSIRYNPVINQTDKKAMLFGCSFTYGTGIEDEETLAANLASQDSSRNYLNFGQEGWGIQQMLINLEVRANQNEFLKETITQSDIGIYFYLEDHIYRLLGKNHLVSYHWGTEFPFYDIDVKKQIVKLDGKLGDQLGALKKWTYFPVHISLLYKTIYFKFFYKGPEPLKEIDYEKAALAIKHSKDLFLKNNPTKKFLVVLFPNTDNTNNGKIKPYLEKQNLEILDLSQLIDKQSRGDHIICKDDNHPNNRLNKMVSKKIFEIL